MPRFRNNFILRELPRNSQATQIELKREYQLNNMSFDSIPKELRGLRACLVCSMVKVSLFRGRFTKEPPQHLFYFTAQYQIIGISMHFFEDLCRDLTFMMETFHG